MKTRRSALSYLTGGAVAVGAVVAAGGLIRSCAPVPTRTTRVDLSDMQDGEARYYNFVTLAQIIVRRGDTLIAWDGLCPISPNYALMQPYDGEIWCHHCTSRFDFNGVITQYWSNPNPPENAPNLNAGQIELDGLTILISEDQNLPRLEWSSL